MSNWNSEIKKWLKNDRVFTFVVDDKNKPEKFASAYHIPFMLISYEMFVNQFESIKSIKFDIIVCDEGHRLKNSNIKASIQLTKLDCKKRLILTGTPIQNDLHEFYSLINFVNPGILGMYNEYKERYETPIVLSQQPDISDECKMIGIERSVELNKIILPFILRRTQDVINEYLPEKQEILLFCKPSKLQKFMIGKLLNFYNDGGSCNNPLEIIMIMKKICNHPSLVQQTTTTGKSSEIIKFLVGLLPSWKEMGPFDSGKLLIVESLLSELHSRREEKIVIISYYTKTLDMLMGLCDHFNYKYCRLDGQTPTGNRQKIISTFNSNESDTFIFLLSAKSGGIGLNLIGASRLILYDNDWNPASDLQAISRIWRDGQKRKVYIYRLITSGTIEEKIFQRQLSKTLLTDAVVDVKETDSGGGGVKFSSNDLKDLFTIDMNSRNCLTHELIECDCKGDGEIPNPVVNEFEQGLKLHELKQWEHHQEPINSSVLNELCMKDVQENILYLFRNKIVYCKT